MSYTKRNFKSNDTLFASQLNAMDSQIYDNDQRITQLMSATPNAGGYRGGTAVVLGDSLFDNSNLLFGKWLMEQNIYDTVHDHAYEGTGFGNTFKYRPRHSLYDLLDDTNRKGSISDNKTRPHRPTTTTYEAIRQHIAEADVIYLSCGGNDIQAHYLYPNLPPDSIHEEFPNTKSFTELVKTCLEKIYALNPNATIYYQMPFNIQWLLKNIKVYLPTASDDLISQTAKAWYEIEKAIATSNANVVINRFFINDFGYFMDARHVHPLEPSAYTAYRNVVYGNYRPKWLDELVISVINGTPDSSDLAEASSLVANKQLDEDCRLLLYTQTSTSKHLTALNRMIETDNAYSYQFIDLNSSSTSGKVNVNNFMITDSRVIIQMYEVSATKTYDNLRS